MKTYKYQIFGFRTPKKPSNINQKLPIQPSEYINLKTRDVEIVKKWYKAYSLVWALNLTKPMSYVLSLPSVV